MFPPRTCAVLEMHGHDAVHVRDRGLQGRPDAEVAAVATEENRILITENVKDFALIPDLVVVSVLKSRLPKTRMGERLAALVHEWSLSNPQPYVGMHWPTHVASGLRRRPGRRGGQSPGEPRP